MRTKGQESCLGIPWPADEGAAGNAEIPYEDDAVEFRPAFKKLLAMASAYAAKGKPVLPGSCDAERYEEYSGLALFHLLYAKDTDR